MTRKLTINAASSMAGKGSARVPRCRKMNLREPFKDQFERLGRFIYRHAWKVCLISFFFNGFLGLGMLRFRPSKLLNNVIEDLYIPTDTPTEEMAEKLAWTFPDKTGYDYFAHQNLKQPLFGEVMLWRHDLGNILEGITYDEIISVINFIKNITYITDDGVSITYQATCARINERCVIQGQEIVEQIMSNADGEIDMDRLHQRDGNHYIPSTDNLAEYEVVNGTLKSAKYIKLVFHLRHDTDAMVADANDWQWAFQKSMRKLKDNKTDVQPPQSLGLAYQHAHSFFEELGEDTFADIPYMSFVFTVFLTYIGFVTSGGNSLAKRMNVARMGYIATPVSVLGAWGLLMACKVEFTNAIGLVPMFLCGAQLMSTLITLSHLSDSYSLETAEERLVYTMRNSAIPITMNTVIHIASFAIGIASKFYVLKLVCIYFVTTLVFGYLNHFVFFMSCVAIHEQRIDKGLHFCMCCTKLSPKEDLVEDGRSCCVICCCSGEKPETREDTESRMERLPRKLMTRFILATPVKAVCILGLLIYTGFYIYGLAHFDVDTMQYNDVKDDSYFAEWQFRWAGRFENKSTVQFIVKHQDGFLRDRELMARFQDSLILKGYLQPDSLSTWYDAFEDGKHNVSTEAELVKAIKKDFLPQNPVYRNDIVFDSFSKRVIMSRIYIQTHHVASTKSMIKLKEDLEEFIDSLNDKTEDDGESRDSDEVDQYVVDSRPRTYVEDKFIVHSPGFLLTDWFQLPLWEMLKICSVQFGLLFIFLLLLNPNFVLPIAIAVGYFSIVGGMFGICYFFGVNSLNAVTFISFLIASCFSVEVVGHSINSLMTVTGTDRAARMNAVLNTVTQALFHPLFGLTLGLIVLVVVESYFFRSVFIIFITTTAICVVNAVFFLPALLSLLGPGDNLPDESVDFFQPHSVSKENLVNEFVLNGVAHGVTAGRKSNGADLNGATNAAFHV